MTETQRWTRRDTPEEAPMARNPRIQSPIYKSKGNQSPAAVRKGTKQDVLIDLQKRKKGVIIDEPVMGP